MKTSNWKKLKKIYSTNKYYNSDQTVAILYILIDNDDNDEFAK